MLNPEEKLTMDDLHSLLESEYNFIDTYDEIILSIANKNIVHIPDNTFNKLYLFKMLNDFTQFKNNLGKGLVLFNKPLSEDVIKIDQRQKEINSFLKEITTKGYQEKFQFRLNQLAQYRGSMVHLLGTVGTLIFNKEIEAIDNLPEEQKIKRITSKIYQIQKDEKIRNTNCDMEKASRAHQLETLELMKRSAEEAKSNKPINSETETSGDPKTPFLNLSTITNKVIAGLIVGLILMLIGYLLNKEPTNPSLTIEPNEEISQETIAVEPVKEIEKEKKPKPKVKPTEYKLFEMQTKKLFNDSLIITIKNSIEYVNPKVHLIINEIGNEKPIENKNFEIGDKISTNYFEIIFLRTTDKAYTSNRDVLLNIERKYYILKTTHNK